MKVFRILLLAMIMALASYTLIVGINYGWDLLPVFFGDMIAMTWPGQFNFDFMCFLLLSGLWTSWRNNFSAKGLLLGIVAVFFGTFFLASYLLFLSYRENGDIKSIIIGPR